MKIDTKTSKATSIWWMQKYHDWTGFIDYSTMPHRLLGRNAIPGKNPCRLTTEVPGLPRMIEGDIGASITACKGFIISVEHPVGWTFRIFFKVYTQFPSRVERIYWLAPATAGTWTTGIWFDAAVVNADVVGSLLKWSVLSTGTIISFGYVWDWCCPLSEPVTCVLQRDKIWNRKQNQNDAIFTLSTSKGDTTGGKGGQ